MLWKPKLYPKGKAEENVIREQLYLVAEPPIMEEGARDSYSINNV